MGSEGRVTKVSKISRIDQEVMIMSQSSSVSLDVVLTNVAMSQGPLVIMAKRSAFDGGERNSHNRGHRNMLKRTWNMWWGLGDRGG